MSLLAACLPVLHPPSLSLPPSLSSFSSTLSILLRIDVFSHMKNYMVFYYIYIVYVGVPKILVRKKI